MTQSISNATHSDMEDVLEILTDLCRGQLVRRLVCRLTAFLFVSSPWMQDLVGDSSNAGSMMIKQENAQTLHMADVMGTRTDLSLRKLARTPATTKSKFWKPQ